MINWAKIAPASPDPSFDPADPDSTGYDWSSLDTLVENAGTAGLTPILDITHPPLWAYAIRPKGVNGGTPDVAALKQFAQALAVHYDGSDGPPAEHIFQV